MSRSGTERVTRPAARSTARLRVVAPPARSRARLVVGCLSLLGAGLVALLLLNVSLEKGAFVRRQQQARVERLLEQRQALREQLEVLEAPQSLAGRAAALGMVQAPNAAFVRASDGRVIGVPSPAVTATGAAATTAETQVRKPTRASTRSSTRPARPSTGRARPSIRPTRSAGTP